MSLKAAASRSKDTAETDVLVPARLAVVRNFLI